MKEGREPEYPEKTPDDVLQKPSRCYLREDRVVRIRAGNHPDELVLEVYT